MRYAKWHFRTQDGHQNAISLPAPQRGVAVHAHDRSEVTRRRFHMRKAPQRGAF